MFSTEDKKMLLDLFHIFAPSRGEEPVLNFIKNILNENNIPFTEDTFGNIYVLNYKNEPLLSAHTDCVGSDEDGFYVKFIDIYNYGEEEILKGIGNIGADDKIGIFLILKYLLSGKHINAFFSVEEEIGGANGISKMVANVKDNEIFKSIPYCLVLDRKNSGDIICYNNSYGSKKFDEELGKIGEDFGYYSVNGGSSDANKIKDYMNCCNLSIAYHNPHSKNEFCSLTELWNTWEYILKIISDLPRNIPLEVKTYSYNKNYSYNYNKGYGTYSYSSYNTQDKVTSLAPQQKTTNWWEDNNYWDL